MDWNPRAKYRMYLNRIQDLLDDERRTVRDIYYALESRGFAEELEVEGYEFKYDYVKRCVKKARRAGYVDPELIIDESRSTAVTPTSTDDPTDFLNRASTIHRSYHEDPWDDQPKHVEVWLEKQALASVFRPICRDKNVRLEATRGDWSDSKVYQAAQRIASKIHDGDDVRILYFGDFNPSGLHAPVSIQETMRHYGVAVRDEDVPDEHFFDIFPFSEPIEYEEADGSIHFERVALTLEQIKKYDLPENPNPSKTDKDRQLRNRFMRLATEGRDVNIELNALKEYHREDLEDMIRDSIDKHVDEEKWEETKEREKERRRKIENAVSVDTETFEE